MLPADPLAQAVQVLTAASVWHITKSEYGFCHPECMATFEDDDPNKAVTVEHHEHCPRQALRLVLEALEQYRTALEAADQFIHPEVDRGPASPGWQNTVDLVDALLRASAEGKG